MEKKKDLRLAAIGALCGVLNGLFGSGGGVVAVLLLRRELGDDRVVHASTTLAVLIMSAASLALYAAFGKLQTDGVLMFIPGGIAGAVGGALWLKSIDTSKLRKLFAAAMCVSGAVMLF